MQQGGSCVFTGVQDLRLVYAPVVIPEKVSDCTRIHANTHSPLVLKQQVGK